MVMTTIGKDNLGLVRTPATIMGKALVMPATRCLVFFIPFLRVCVSKIAMVVSFLVGGGGAGVVVVVVLFFVDVPIAARSRRTAVVMATRVRTTDFPLWTK
jgi:hypothetical protein